MSAIREKPVEQLAAGVGDTLAPVSDVPVITIQPSRGWASLGLRSIWEYRELLYFLAWRDIKVRYKQTAIGAAWAIIQPLLTMALFTAIFGRFAKIPSDGLPYPIFAYSALLPWNFFSGALTRTVASVVGSSHLITKVYFPRLVIPTASTISGIVDFSFSFIVLLGMMVWFGIRPHLGVLALPLLLLLAQATALAVGLWFSALNVKYRDVGYAIPFIVQLWMFASPLAYPVSMIPERWRLLYSLNPMVGVIEGFRWALLGKAHPDWMALGISITVVTLLLFSGAAYFRRMERTFGDII
jgi:lipopolysaccharide transport system permease protein